MVCIKWLFNGLRTHTAILCVSSCVQGTQEMNFLVILYMNVMVHIPQAGDGSAVKLNRFNFFAVLFICDGETERCQDGQLHGGGSVCSGGLS